MTEYCPLFIRFLYSGGLEYYLILYSGGLEYYLKDSMLLGSLICWTSGRHSRLKHKKPEQVVTTERSQRKELRKYTISENYSDGIWWTLFWFFFQRMYNRLFGLSQKLFDFFETWFCLPKILNSTSGHTIVMTGSQYFYSFVNIFCRECKRTIKWSRMFLFSCAMVTVDTD